MLITLPDIDLSPVYEWVSKSERRSVKIELNWDCLSKLNAIPVNSDSNQRRPNIKIFAWESSPVLDFHDMGKGIYVKLPTTVDEIDLALKADREKEEFERYEKLKAKFETRAEKEKAPAIEAEDAS
ncbi:hypothetical protein Desde_1050 [Desulfitobacterium dehalogenans ATCC 51507]|uniref:Uncharacterized protein n=1 Tax=Desulfitobacterium dehalogenans (strain ATCC 51507 / DSM 9161 / JW/IU-DC1) TaxID=756499 RepID=I4A698_DESDJ|nr:hypothetical protein [Desulfitobacterium dehalogenans]AFL99482.1 hypothetical protein Desde_1050 [Desulfitobacterium dehalogenans ATCC 51507]